MKKEWTLKSWQEFKAEQQPDWETTTNYSSVLNKIKNYPPLVFAGEVRVLKEQFSI